MHRSLSGAALAATSLALAVAAPSARAAGDPIMPLSDVKAGMQCQGRTVESGLEPTPFDVTVVAVDGGPRPFDAHIVIKVTAAKFGGIAEGDSGSPIYCPGADGVMRVIGAVSYGIGQYDNTVGYATPIEAMLAEPTTALAPAAPLIGVAPGGATATSKTKSKKAKAATATSTTPTVASDPGQIPLTLAGPTGALAKRFVSAAAKAGQKLLIGPLASRSEAPAGGVKPGDALAATQVYGDVYAGAIGTVTYVDGNKVYAFGHPFSGTGPSNLQLERAQIETVIDSPTIADQASYKLGSAIGPVGTLTFDGSDGITGLIGAAPASIPVATTIRDATGAVIQQANANVVDERPVRGGGTTTLLGLAAAANAGTALQRLATQQSVGGSARACTTVFLKKALKPLSECVDSIVPSPGTDGGVETGVAGAVSAAIDPLTSAERFMDLVDHVQTDITYRREADDAEIEKLIAPKHPKAGSTITVRVVVQQGSTGDRREVPVKVKIPREAKKTRTAIVIVGDAIDTSGGAASSSDGSSIDIIFGDDTAKAPANIDALRTQYTTDGESGLRAIVAPGLAGKNILLGIQGSDATTLSDDEITALQEQAKLVYETPSVALSSGASLTITPR